MVVAGTKPHMNSIRKLMTNHNPSPEGVGVPLKNLYRTWHIIYCGRILISQSFWRVLIYPSRTPLEIPSFGSVVWFQSQFLSPRFPRPSVAAVASPRSARPGWWDPGPTAAPRCDPLGWVHNLGGQAGWVGQGNGVQLYCNIGMCPQNLLKTFYNIQQAHKAI